MMKATRRGFLGGLGALLAMPAIVKVGSIMPVRVPFHQRFSWEVFIPGRGAEKFMGYALLELPLPLRAGCSIEEALAPLGCFPPSEEYVTRSPPLRGAELNWAETYNIPRIEILKIGDRVVGKRQIGTGCAQIMPRPHIAEMECEPSALAYFPSETDALAFGWEAPKANRVRRTAYVSLDGDLREDSPLPDELRYPTRESIEARHREASAGSRQRAASVFDALRAGRVA